MDLDIRQIYHALSLSQILDLENEEAQKYYIDFSSVRGRHIIEDIRDTITLWSPDKSTCQLFTGHIGCGKSTELLRLKMELELAGYHVVYIDSIEELEMSDVEISEILLMIARRVSESFNTLNIPEPRKLKRLLKGAAEIFESEIMFSASNSISTETDQFLLGISNITARSKDNPSLRNKFRRYLEPRTGIILEAINIELLETARKKLKQNGKSDLVVIVDHLDRIDSLQKPWGRSQPEYLFIDRSTDLGGLNCHVIYTVPIMLRFLNDFATVAQRFGFPRVMTPIPLQSRDGSVNKEAIHLLRIMVLTRVFPNLDIEQRLSKVNDFFDTEETLDRLCLISGGNLRVLIRILRDCLIRESGLPISRKTLENVILKYGNEQKIVITKSEWELLRRVRQNKRISVDEEYQTLIRSLFIYEYQDSLGSWFDTNPILSEILKLQDKEEKLNKFLHKAQQFLRQIGADTIKQDNILRVTSVSGRLMSYAPLPVMFAEQPIAQDVLKLKQQAARLNESHQTHTGLLLYQKQPDTLFRIKMAEVRLRDHFILIPIPFAAVEQALMDEATSIGLLAHYIKRYMPGADLLDDRNAIGDTLSFYGRGYLLHSLEEDLRRCQGIGLFGIRKSGKTSILLQLGFSLRQYPVVYIDLQPYGGKLHYGAELFNEILQKLSYLLKENSKDVILNIEAFETDCPAKEIATKFTRKVCELASVFDSLEYKLPIICFLDEIERILPLKTDAKERVEEFNAFFGALRELSQTSRNLSLLCADVHMDFNRINNWPQDNVPTNPVFQFFKEVFISPFSQEETTTMLTEIGQLMGIEFDPELLEAIYISSGGHPFIARQLASKIYKQVNKQKPNGRGTITLISANRILQHTFKYLDILKDYFKENIWADLEKRKFFSAMAIIRLLSCNEELKEGLSEVIILEKLNNQFTENECESALIWLENVGLIIRQESDQEDYYRMQIQLMSRWLRRGMTKKEIRQWQIYSEISD